MQKYIKKDLSEIRYFEGGIQVGDWIDLSTFRLMTGDEIDKLENPEKYMNDEEKELLRLSRFKPLTRRQFKLVLLENDLLHHIENAISAIEDNKTRARIQIEYTEATEFHRTSESVVYMCTLLGLTDDQVDTMWEQALTL